MKRTGSARILIIEDEPSLINVLSVCLENWGFSVIAVSSIGEAAKIAAAMPPPDLVLLDLSLPDSPQPEETIKKIPVLAPYAPVVVLTGHTDEKLIKTAADNGASAFVFKPNLVKEDLLLKIIEKVIESKGRYESAEKSAENLEKVEEKIVRLSNGGAK